MHQDFLPLAIDTLMALGQYRTILCNAPSGLNNTSPVAQVLATEVVPTSAGYQSQPFLYTPGTSEVVAGGYRSTPSQAATFVEAVTGFGYTYTHAALVQGRGAISSRPITEINPANSRFTVPGHGFGFASPVVLASSGQLPNGAQTVIYYALPIDVNIFELYTNANATTKLIITDAGTGTPRICNANCRITEVQTNGGEVQPGQSVAVLTLFQLR